MDSAKTTTDTSSLKDRLRATWIAGDFGQIAKSTASGAEDFIQRLNLQPGMTVLDVACGTGNLAVPAARTGAIVTGVDIASNLLEQGQARAAAEGLTIQFDEGDAEKLSYPDASFDVVVTMFGAMFAPSPELVASELKRVCKPGGLIAMANWTPTGFVGKMFGAVSRHVPPPPGMQPPVLWGIDETVRERFGEGISKIETTPRMITFTYPFPPAAVVEHFRKYFGPTIKAFGTLDENGQTALAQDLEQLWTSINRATDGTFRGEAEYLEVIATRC